MMESKAKNVFDEVVLVVRTYYHYSLAIVFFSLNKNRISVSFLSDF